MEVFFIKLLQFILSISLLVFLHEGGHMLASKLFGIRVEKFFIFFDLSVGKWSGKLFSFGVSVSIKSNAVITLSQVSSRCRDIVYRASTPSRCSSPPSLGSSVASPLGSALSS